MNNFLSQLCQQLKSWFIDKPVTHEFTNQETQNMVNPATNPTTTKTTSLSDFVADFPQSKDPKICKLAEDFADRLLDKECEAKEFIIDAGHPHPHAKDPKAKVCKPADIPELAPCFQIHWGDGPKDMIETTDTECLCITACNPYSNVTFKDLTVVISVVTKADGTPVPELPDGTPSVYIKPAKFVCFGDLPPCDPHKPDKQSCLSRELVLVSCGAKEGDYCFKILYCYSIHFDLKGVEKFKLPLCAS